MQPKFTQKNLGSFCTKIIALALIFSASTQFTFAQQKPTKSPQLKPGFENTLNNFEKQKLQASSKVAQQAKTGNTKDNDAGILSKASKKINSPEAICTTWTFSITAADPPTSLRAFRDGVPKTCAAPGTCQAGIGGAFNYKIFQWVCPATQCVTVTYNATNASFSFVTVHNVPPVLTNLCTGWVGDPGSSATPGTPIVFSFNGVAGTTYHFLVTNVGAPPSDGTIQIDANVCSSTPCSGTPAPGNTIGTPNPVGAGAPLTLSVSNNPAVAGLVHYWQRSTTGSAPWTTIGSGPANTFVTSQVVASWYRDSVVCTPGTAFGISTPVLVNLLACGWSASTAYPIPVLDQANVTVGTTLYSFAGVSNSAVIATSYKFDGTVWTPIAPTPQPLEYPAAVSDGGDFIYILGGASSTGVSLTTLYRYSISANTYTTLAPFSTGVWNPAAAYISGKIYKFCGTAAASTNVMEVYTVASNTWAAGTPYPQALSFVTAIARNGFIYAAGGVATATLTATNAAYRFDPGTNAWTPMANMAAQHWGASGDFYNNGFVVSGGYINGATTIGPNTEQLDLVANTWSPLPNQLTASGRMGGAAMGGSYYNIGGRTAASAAFVGTTLNQKLFCVPPSPCTGTPNPGLTIASANPVCSGTSFTLSLQNNPFVSGFTYQWQSAPTSGGPWTNLPGGTNVTHTLTQTGATCYRAIVTCTPSGLSGTSTPVCVADGQGVFNSHPVNTSVQCGGTMSFNFTATGNALVYAWEYRVNAATPWQNVNNGPGPGGVIFSGATTNTLTLTGVPSTINGYQFRGLISGPCTAVDFSNVATLTVTPLVATVNVTSPVSICTGTIVQLSLTNANSPATTVFSSGPLNIQIPDVIGPPASSNPVVEAGISHVIPVALPAGSAITRIDLTVNITHTYSSDLKLVLKNSGTGEVMNLFYHKSGAQTPGANMTNTVISSVGTVRFSAVAPPFTGVFRADFEMNPGSYGDAGGAGPTAFQPTVNNWPALWGGVNQGSGNWTLAICDAPEWAGDIGTLTSWSMAITYGAPASGIWTQTSPATPNSMFTDPGATIPYTGGLANTIYVRPLATAPFTGNSATYCVVYSTTAPACTSNPTCVTVNVSSPITGLVPPANRTVCVGSTATFTVGSGGGPLTYQWEVSINNGLTWSPIAGATGATLTLTNVTQLMNNNLYRVTVTAGPCGSSLSAPARLNVNQLPIVTISSNTLQLVPGQIATITGTSVPPPFSATSWSWTRNGSTIVGANTNTVTANIDQQGAYQATVTDVNGCVGTSNTVTIGSAVSDRLWIIPNPNTGTFVIRLFFNGAIGERRIVKIYSAGGQLMAQKEVDMDSQTPPYATISFNLPTLAAGTYVVKVVDRNSQNITSGLMVIQ